MSNLEKIIAFSAFIVPLINLTHAGRILRKNQVYSTDNELINMSEKIAKSCYERKELLIFESEQDAQDYVNSVKKKVSIDLPNSLINQLKSNPGYLDEFIKKINSDSDEEPGKSKKKSDSKLKSENQTLKEQNAELLKRLEALESGIGIEKENKKNPEEDPPF